MTAIVEDVQSQGITSAIVTLYDLEYAEGSFVYFYPDGLDSDLTTIDVQRRYRSIKKLYCFASRSRRF